MHPKKKSRSKKAAPRSAMAPKSKWHRSLGHYIYTIRKSQDLSQMDIAKAMKMSQSRWSKIECGILQPSLFDWLLFSDLTNISVDPLRGIQELQDAKKETHDHTHD